MIDESINAVGSVSISKLHIYAPDITLQLKRGMRSAQATDALKLKTLAVQLTGQTGDSNSRTGRGFNNNELGRMLVLVNDFEAYKINPVVARPLPWWVLHGQGYVSY